MIDLYGRTIDYLRVSITDRCNLRCRYCLPGGEETVAADQERYLNLEEVLRVCQAAERIGIRKFKITGGEPLVRQDCLELIRRLKELPETEAVTLTTNGVLLKRALPELKRLSIDGINVSLDTLKPVSYTHLDVYKRQAYIKVQDGCNQFCSYCIIPYARGRVRSRDLSDVLSEVKRLAESGFQEVVLTGIHLSSYGIDNGENLLQLILKTMEVPGIRRVRLGSLEPRIITEEFVNALKGQEKFCPHFHLSLQSGCDATLKRMNRRYTAEEYYEKCVLLREKFDHPALTTDVIVGFPGETEEEFAETEAFLKKIAFYETHIFKYSRRKGTKADAMEHQIPEEIKAKRSDILLKLDKEHRKLYEAVLTGTEQEVLFEEKVTLDGKEWFVGHTKEYVKIAVPAAEDLSNQLRTVKVSGQRAGELLTAEVR